MYNKNSLKILEKKMLTVPIHDFQADVISYLHLIKKGEQITVTENGESLATIAPTQTQKKLTLQDLNAPITKSILGMFADEDDGEDYKTTLHRVRMEKFS